MASSPTSSSSAKGIFILIGIGMLALLLAGLITGAIGSALLGNDSLLPEPGVHLPAQQILGDDAGKTLEGGMDIQGILGMDSDVRNGFDGIKVTYQIDADASQEDIEAIVAQSQKRSAVYDIITNPTNVTVDVS